MISREIPRRILLCAFAVIISLAFGLAAPITRNVNANLVSQRNTVVKAADRLAATQNNDGGWEFENPDTNPANASPYNTLGVTAQGVLDAYRLTANSGYLAVAIKSYNGLLTRSASPDPTTHKMRGPDISFLVELSEATGNSEYANFAKARWDSAKNEFGSGTAGGVARYIRNIRVGSYPALISWDINLYVQGMMALERYYPGQSFAVEADSMAEVIYASLFVAPKDFDAANTAQSEYWLSFTGAIDAFASTNLHTSEKASLTASLLASQAIDGHFIGVGDGSDVQTTAYAILSLLKAGGNDAATNSAENYLMSSQQDSGGWKYGTGTENTEITSEAVHAMFKLLGGAFCTIQDAINAASSGDIINVAAGTYVGSDIIIGKSLTLTGATGAKIVVPDSAVVNGIDIKANNVTITGFEIAGPVSSSYTTYTWTKISRGIVVIQGVTGFSITNNNIHDVRNGILVNGINSTGSITDNRIENTKSGISIQYTNTTGITIRTNTQGPIGNEWGVNLHLNGYWDGATIHSNPYPGGAAPVSVQEAILANSSANAGWTVQDQAYASFNRTQAQVATTGSSGAQGSLLTPINTVQGGVDAVVSGGKVYIAAGTYTLSGAVNVNKSLTLSGTGESNTTVDASANGTGYAILVSASNVSLSNFTIKPPLVPALLGKSNGGGFAVHVSNTPGIVSNVTITHITVKNGNRTGIDLNGVDNATLSYVTSQIAAYGNGISLSGVHGAHLSYITTGGNTWGGIAVYCSQYTQPNRGSDSINVDAPTCTITEPNKIYAQNEFGVTNSNVGINSYDYIIKNNANDVSSGYVWYQDTLINAVKVATTLVDLAWPHADTASTILKISTGKHQVASGMRIQAAIDVASAGDTVEVLAGTYDESIIINKLVDIQGAGIGSTILTKSVLINAGAGSGRARLRKLSVITTDSPYKVDTRYAIFIDGSSGNTGPVTIDSVKAKIYPTLPTVYGVGLLISPEGNTINDVVISHCMFDSSYSHGVYIKNATATKGTVNALQISNSSFNDNDRKIVAEGRSFSGYGLYILAPAASPTLIVDGLTVTNSTFNGNYRIGLYIESLKNASFSGVTATGNGEEGVNLNLKYGRYSNISFDKCTFTNNSANGITLNSGVKPDIHSKGRDDAPYNTNPASLSNVNITSSVIGYAGFGNNITNSPVLTGSSIQTGILNYMNSGSVNCIGNWWGTTDTAVISSRINGTVAYSPWWDKNYIDDSHTSAWVWSANSDLSAAIKTASNGDTINFLGSYSGKLDNAKNVNVKFAVQPVLDSVTVTTGDLVLSSPITISGNLNLTNGNIITGDTNKIVLDTNATNPVETSSGKIIGTIEAAPRKVGTDSLHLLGLAIQSGKDDLGKVSVQRTSGDAAIVTIADKPSIAMTWNIQADNQPTKGRDVVFSWLPDFDNSVDTSSVAVYRNEGSGWQFYAGPFRVSGVPRQVSVHTTGFSSWTVKSILVPVISLNTKNIIFPSVKLGQQKDTVITVSNTGNDTLKITNIASTKSYFSQRPSTLTIPPGQTKNDTIRFTPDSIGSRSAFVVFTSNAVTSPDTIMVSGYGVGTPILGLNKSSVAFGSIKIGQWKDSIMTASNLGTDTLKIASIASTKSYFSPRPSVLTIPPGQTKNDTIRFTPDSIGSRSAFVVFTSNAVTSPDEIAVSGFGVGTPVLTLGKSNITFASTKIGQWKDTVVTITNTGNDTLKISGVASTKSCFSARPTFLTISPGQTQSDTIRFMPDSIGTRIGTILFTSNATTSPDTIYVSGYGVGAPVLALSKSSAAFSSVLLGQWKDTTITISNSGNDTLKITGITSSNGVFSARPTTRFLAPGQSMADTLRFTPAAIGSAFGKLLITSNAETSPDTISVSGFGYGIGALQLGARTITFGTMKLGQWKDSSVTVFNGGSDTLKITNISSTKSYFTARPATLTIPPGQTLSDTIRFVPDSIGTRISSVLFTSNAPTSPDTINLSGYGVGTPAMLLSKSTITFLSVKIGQWKDTAVSISNTGNDTLKITNIASNKSYYSARPSALTIPPGQSKTDTVRYTPDSIGIRSALVLFTSNDSTSPDTVRVSGYGFGTPVLALNRPNIAFPSVKIGQWKDTVVTVTNTGNDTLKISGIASTKNYFSARPTALAIPPGQTRNDTIRFAPDSIGIRGARLLFTSNDAGSPDTIVLTGYGTGTAVLALSTRSINFPTLGIGQWKDTAVTITNSGNDTLKISSIASTKSYFSASPASFVLPPGQNGIDTIRFTADSSGSRRAIILITSNAVTSPDTISVIGNGTTTGVLSYGSEIPKSFMLFQNYPNPFNPSTTIRFGLPVRSHVRIDLYNILGQRIERLVDEDANAGYFEKVWFARAASGFYLYRIEANALDDPSRQFISTKKLLLLK